MFSIEIKRLYWLSDDSDNAKDEPKDLCLHGDVVVHIGSERFEENCTVSATALYLLKSLTEDRVAIYTNEQLLPCCGHCFFEHEKDDTVWNCGCANGVDWHVRHTDHGVELETQSGAVTVIPLQEYRAAVFAFADAIKAHYDNSLPKTPEDELDLIWYPIFWREWARRRGA